MFVVTFFNTALISLLDTAAFEDNRFLAMIFDSQGETDFNENWYSVTGRGLMLNVILEPIVGTLQCFAAILLTKFWRFYDRGFTQDYTITKQTSVVAYVRLYSGCEFNLHERYADVLLVIGMALFYGTAMPLMYLFALISLSIMYVRETLFIYYLYKRPPQFDSRGTKMTLYIICMLAIASLPFAFWQLGNR